MKKIKMTAVEIEEFMSKIREHLANEKGIPDRLNLPLNGSVKLEENDKIRVIFSNEAYKKMRALIEQSPKEIGWHGVVEHPSEKIYEITDIILFPQTVTGATVTTDDEEYNNWLMSVEDDVFNKLRFYGHSHVNMSTHPSVTDDTYIKNIIQNCNDFYIFGILNKRNDSWFNIYDIKNNILYESSDIVYEYYITEADSWAKEQIDLFVTEYKAPVSQYGQYQYGGFQRTQNLINQSQKQTYGETAFQKAKDKQEKKDKDDKNPWNRYANWNKDYMHEDYDDDYYR